MEETQTTSIPIREDNPKSRLTVVQTVSFLQEGAEPVVADSRWGEWLKTDEQPYVRRLKIGPKFQKVDTGWVKNIARLVIANEDKEHTLCFCLEHPEDQSTWIEGMMEIPPGDFLSCRPWMDHKLGIIPAILLCCPDEAEVRVTVYVFPGD